MLTAHHPHPNLPLRIPGPPLGLLVAPSVYHHFLPQTTPRPLSRIDTIDTIDSKRKFSTSIVRSSDSNTTNVFTTLYVQNKAKHLPLPSSSTPMTIPSSLVALGEEVEDSETETFLLFSQSTPSHDLGFVDKTATQLELSIDGRDLVVQQSPTLLSSNRAEGTTGAVCWKITPLFAAWMISPSNPLFRSSLIDKNATVLELGCGTSSIIPAVLSPHVSSYIATDLEYIINGNLLQKNFAENSQRITPNPPGPRHRTKKLTDPLPRKTNVEFLALDWESSDIADLPQHCKLPNGSIDAIIACDCIYNEALIAPFVQTCADLCRLRSESVSVSAAKPTICVIAQQLRSDAVFDEWLSAFHACFRVWRVPDDLLTDELKGGEGFCVHVGVLRER